MKFIVITSGDQDGIGPQIALAAAAQLKNLPLLVLGDKSVFEKRAAQLNLPMPANFQHVSDELSMLKIAAQGCLDKSFSALVTGPVNKAKINKITPFTGHTEWLAQFCGVKKTVMCLANPQLTVALMTTHLPLRDVANTITETNITETIKIIRNQFPTQKIYVCGLNPHAGEAGLLGREEIEIISPALNNLNDKNIVGPLPADTVFLQALNQNAVVLAMYHDQGLATVKTLDFEHTVNVTLGLPFIRTSVDHGTAYDLVGTNKASCASLVSAINLAKKLTF